MAEADGYAAIARGFDALAPAYDEIVENNALHRLLRVRSLEWLEEAFPPGSRVLEIGCGTGVEGVEVAKRGVDVVATDVAPRMVAEARRRVRQEGLQDRMTVRVCSAASLGTEFAGDSFDGAYASLGALNCEPHLREVIQDVGGLLRSDAPFLLSVVNRPCLMELASGLVSLQWRKAFRRMADRTEIDLYGAAKVRVRALSEGTLRRALAPGFRVDRIEGLLILLPPPYLAPWWTRLGALRGPLARLERRMRSVWPFRGLGDHLHVWARKVGP